MKLDIKVERETRLGVQSRTYINTRVDLIECFQNLATNLVHRLNLLTKNHWIIFVVLVRVIKVPFHAKSDGI